jgi:alpha-L-arabinofuranosidase
VKFEGDAADAIQPLENVHYGQSVILNTKTRQLFVKICNATAETKTAHLNLSRFKVGKFAEKMTISGQPDDENNFDKQPIAPVKETIKMKKRMDVEVAPYSFSLITIKL